MNKYALAARLSDLSLHLMTFVHKHVANNDFSSFLGKYPGFHSTHPSGTTADQCHFVLQAHKSSPTIVQSRSGSDVSSLSLSTFGSLWKPLGQTVFE